jgi:hypothetical protein
LVLPVVARVSISADGCPLDHTRITVSRGATMSQSAVSQADAESKKSQAAIVQTKTWRYFLRSSPEDAANFANVDPAQGAGEASFSVRDDGQTDTFLYF